MFEFFFFFKFEFGLVLFSCIPSFNFLLFLEQVKKFSVVAVESNLKYTIFGPKLKQRLCFDLGPS